MSISAPLGGWLGQRRHLLSDALRRELDLAKLPPTMNEIVRLQLYVEGNNRRCRTMLLGMIVLYTFEAAGGQPISGALPAAISVELLAAAASVLDDLQDGDPISGLPREDGGSGAELAILLLTLAHKAIAKNSGLGQELRASCFAKLIEYEFAALVGQHVANEAENSRSLSEALLDSGRKSGSFGRLAGEMGGLFAAADRDEITSLGQFGWHLLVIDQLQNDVAGIWPGRVGGTDLAQSRMTVPITFARRLADDDRTTIPAVPNPKPRVPAKGSSNRSAARAGRAALFRSGAVHYSWVAAARHRFRASKIADYFEARNPGSLLSELIQSA